MTQEQKPRGNYLGRLSTNPYQADSVSNLYGSYGSRYSPRSINKPFGRNGSRFSSEGAKNPHTIDGPDLIAADGTLIYLSGSVSLEDKTLSWVNRLGETASLLTVPKDYRHIRISPDGRQLLLEINDGQIDIWSYDFERDTLSRLTFSPALDGVPVWAPDSSGFVFASNRHPDNERMALFQGAAEKQNHAILFENFFDYLKEKLPIE